MAINTTSSVLTPQAADDVYESTENYLTSNSILYLDVMSNDAGGKAKTLWSIDDGYGNPIAPENLLSSDIGDGWEATAFGNQIRINNGKIEYKLGNADAVNALAAGEVMTDSFTYAIRLGNGTLSIARVQVKIVGDNDAPTVTGFTNGAVTEDSAPTTLSTSVSVNFNDVDLSDTLSYSFAKSSGTLGGTLSLLNSNDSGNAANGSVSYTYNVNNSAVQYLAAGQTATETFTITANDGHGGTVSQLVSVTVTGTNDAPTVTGFTNGAVTEDATSPTLNANVTVNFNDVDLSDTLSYSFVKSSGSLGGTLSLLNSNDSGNAANGSVSYTYNVDNSAVQYLAANETVTETFTITANDGHGGTVSQLVTVTVAGTNDAPTIVSVVDGAVTEDATSPTLNTNVTVNFNDVDLSDTLSYSFLKSRGALGGTLSLLSSNDSGNTAAGSVTYTYSVDNSAVQYLAEGQTMTENFSVFANDGHGAIVGQTVTVRIIGTNDTPTVTGYTDGAVIEDSASTLNTTVSVNFNDIDLRDKLSYSFVKSSGALGGTLSLLSSNDSSDDDTTNTSAIGSVSYTYNVDNSAVQYLAVGQTATETFTITANDGHGGTVSQLVTVTVTGTNDKAVISGNTSGTIAEDAVPNTVQGNLNSTDVDNTNDLWQAVTTDTNSANGYGTFTMDNAGQWVYTLNNSNTTVNALNNGQSLSDSFTVKTVDGTEQIVSITIQGHTDSVSVTVAGVYNGNDDPNNNNNDSQILATAQSGTSNADTLKGTVNADNIDGNNGNDTIYGGAGNDTLNGNNNDDLIYGGSGNDNIDGGGGLDTVYGGTGNDAITGQNEADTIYGGSGNDTINGGGGNANDLIIGGYGADSLTGGNGSDTFKFLDVLDTGDSISDFIVGAVGDVLDFSAIANITDNAAHLSNSVTAHGVNYFQSGANTIVWADTDGVTSTVEMEVTLVGVTAADLTSGNFSL